MAAPSYATDLSDITTAFTSTDWNLITEGGGGANTLTAPERDDGIYEDGTGAVCVSRNPFSSSIRGVAYDRAAITVATDDAVFYWWKADVAAALDSFANGGVHLVMGSSLTAYKKFYAAGNDTYQLGGWRCTPIDPTATSDLDRGTPGSPDYDTFGVAFDVPSTGPSKGFPFKCSMIRHGRSVDVTAGDSGTPATWDALTTYADAGTRRWGIVQATDTGAVVQGIINWGTATTSVYSRDSNRAIVLADTLGFVDVDFTQLIFANASTDVVWDGMTFTALGTLNRGIVTVNNNAAVTITNSVISGINTTTDGGTNSVWDSTKWIGCNAITSAGGSFLDCQVLTPTVAADTSGFVYNIAADPGGEIDGMKFTKGTNAHHAIEFGTSSPTSISLNGIDFSGFASTNGQNDSMLHFKRTSGTITVNLSGCTVNGGAGTITYKKETGATVNLVASNTLELTGLKNPTEVRVFDAGTTTEIAGQESVTTGTFSTSIDSATYPSVDVSILSLGYQNARLLSISMATNRSIPVSQVIDRQYLNP